MGVLLALVAIKRWLGRHLYGLGLLLSGRHDIAILLYFILLFPGVVVHELSHWLTAKLLRVPTGGIFIGPTRKGAVATRFGAVSVARTDPLRGSVIGLAPLLSGSALILLIAYLVLGLTVPQQLAINLPAQDILGTMWSYLSIPNFWLWVYVIFSISNAMLPSESDRQAWFSLALYCGVAVLVLYGLGIVQQVPVEVSWLLMGLNHLTFAFLVTIVVDAAVIVVVLLLERAVMALTGRKVEY